MTFTKLEDGKYKLEDGRVMSRAELIRELFNTDWRRKDIAKELGVEYNVVFQATANMTNKYHAPGQNGVAVAKAIKLADGTEMPRAEYIRQEVAKGRSKAEIAKELGISYSAIWNATKGVADATSTVQRHFVEVDGKQIPRTEYIRQRFQAGATRREIANELSCDYTVVWQATRTLKGKEDEGEQANKADQPAPASEQPAPKKKAKRTDDGGNDQNFPE